MSNLLHVGKGTPRTIEIDKVTGRAIYINDLKLHGSRGLMPLRQRPYPA
ncbi:hypothetical protein ES703_40197 [subsurface metagenome]